MTIRERERVDAYDHPDAHGENPGDFAGVLSFQCSDRNISFSQADGVEPFISGIEQYINGTEVKPVIDENEKHEHVMILRTMARSVVVHTMNKRTAEAALAILGTSAAAAATHFLLHKKDGKWGLGIIPFVGRNK